MRGRWRRRSSPAFSRRCAAERDLGGRGGQPATPSDACEVRAAIVHLRDPIRPEIRDELEPPRLERTIGVVYRPDTELQSHYFHATLPHQFDEYVWIDETSAVRPVTEATAQGLPAAHPLHSTVQRRHGTGRSDGIDPARSRTIG
jgi:hypothetical protein